MSMSAEKTQEIVEYLKEVRKVISTEPETPKNGIDKRLDLIFNRFFSENDPDMRSKEKNCWKIAEERLRIFESLELKRSKNFEINSTNTHNSKKEVNKSLCIHEGYKNSSKRKAKSWRRAIAETSIWYVAVSLYNNYFLSLEAF